MNAALLDPITKLLYAIAHERMLFDLEMKRQNSAYDPQTVLLKIEALDRADGYLRKIMVEVRDV